MTPSNSHDSLDESPLVKAVGITFSVFLFAIVKVGYTYILNGVLQLKKGHTIKIC